MLVSQLSPIHCDLIDCGPSGSSVHGILQARILERVAIPFSRGSSNPGIEPGSLHYRQIPYCLSHQGSPNYSQIVAKRNVFMWNIALKAQTQGSSRTLLWSWPLGTEVVSHLSRRASDSFRLYHPRVSISQARRLNKAGWETAGHRGGIPFGRDCKPAELTKPLLPHPLLRLLQAHPPALYPSLFYTGDSRTFSPSSPSCHYPCPLLERFSPQWHWTTSVPGAGTMKRKFSTPTLEDNFLLTELLCFFHGPKKFFPLSPYWCHPVLIKESSGKKKSMNHVFGSLEVNETFETEFQTLHYKMFLLKNASFYWLYVIPCWDATKLLNILRHRGRTTIWPRNPIPGHIPEENHNSKRYMHTNVH